MRLSRKTALVLFSFLIAGVGCAGASDKWTGGVDATFKYHPEERLTLVIDVPPGTKSLAAGLAPGDRVLAVDGVDLTKASLGEVKGAMRGPVGTFAVLTVQRGSGVLEVTVERMPDKKKRRSSEAEADDGSKKR